jgi:hypothetical protein
MTTTTDNDNALPPPGNGGGGGGGGATELAWLAVLALLAWLSKAPSKQMHRTVRTELTSSD